VKLLEAIVRRVAPCDALVLRGGMMLRRWLPTRPVDDVDYLGLCAREEAQGLLEGLLARDLGDGVGFVVTRGEVIWGDSAFPGLRLVVRANVTDVQVDIGFGDRLVPPAERVALFGADVLGTRAETLFAWKLHGLFERGPGRWRPKDLHDAWALWRGADLDRAAAAEAVRAAFVTRGDDLELLRRIVLGRFGTSKWAAHKWSKYKETRPDIGELREAADGLARALGELAVLPP